MSEDTIILLIFIGLAFAIGVWTGIKTGRYLQRRGP